MNLKKLINSGLLLSIMVSCRVGMASEQQKANTPTLNQPQLSSICKNHVLLQKQHLNEHEKAYKTFNTIKKINGYAVHLPAQISLKIVNYSLIAALISGGFALCTSKINTTLYAASILSVISSVGITVASSIITGGLGTLGILIDFLNHKFIGERAYQNPDLQTAIKNRINHIQNTDWKTVTEKNDESVLKISFLIDKDLNKTYKFSPINYNKIQQETNVPLYNTLTLMYPETEKGKNQFKCDHDLYKAITNP
jgi:hypothetical protein